MPDLAAASPAPPEAQEKKPLKPCCACPETKKARDAWSVRGRGGTARLPQARLRSAPWPSGVTGTHTSSRKEKSTVAISSRPTRSACEPWDLRYDAVAYVVNEKIPEE
ncbi:hypothetical protein U0070_017098 [Myodes glareolus]|uniref:Uncharacterized protein n=1 Tax=Myodes glareolus TaxID=447135 RepID=A0AAW0JHS0_MYOGA